MPYREFAVNLIFSKEVLFPEDVYQKNILVISNLYNEESIRQLFISAYGSELNIKRCGANEIQETAMKEKFDVIFHLDGLEAERCFPKVVSDMKAVCRGDGIILLITRTPDDDSSSIDVSHYEEFFHYEDYWRYDLDDLQELFSDCQLLSTIYDDEEPFVAAKFIKPLKFNECSAQNIPIYNCRWHKKICYGPDAFFAGYFAEFKFLDELGRKYGTAKSSLEMHYLEKYELFLGRFVNKKFLLLELGVFGGASARMWKEYFPLAEIVGVDINPDCQKHQEERLRIVTADMSSREALQQLVSLQASVIIDDASHLWSHQILALFTLFPSLPSGGIYILEDLGTSLNPKVWPGYNDIELSGYDICSRIAEVVTGKTHLRSDEMYKEEIEKIGMLTDMITFIKGSCILVKR